jgi:hypothetical protein
LGKATFGGSKPPPYKYAQSWQKIQQDIMKKRKTTVYRFTEIWKLQILVFAR